MGGNSNFISIGKGMSKEFLHMPSLSTAVFFLGVESLFINIYINII